jgi:nucleotide-binding universal stress UspA family protein
MVEPFHAILCPVDFSENARRALEYAAYMARRCEGTLHLLYVLPPSDAQMPAELYHPAKSGGVDRGGAEATAKDKLHQLAQEHCSGGIRCEIHTRTGEAASVVLAVAEAIAATLIVMATHGRTGLSRLVWGSVTEQVIRESVCPVLAIPG